PARHRAAGAPEQLHARDRARRLHALTASDAESGLRAGPADGAYLAPAARRALAVLVVGPEDVEDEAGAAGGGGEEAEDGEAGIPEDAEGGLHAHEQGRPHDERGQDEAHGDAVGDLDEPLEQHLLV